MSYDEDDGFDNGFKMYDDTDEDEFSTDIDTDTAIEEEYEEDPDNRYT